MYYSYAYKRYVHVYVLILQVFTQIRAGRAARAAAAAVGRDGVSVCRAQAEHRLRRLWAVGGRREDRRPLQYEDAGEPGRAARE